MYLVKDGKGGRTLIFFFANCANWRPYIISKSWEMLCLFMSLQGTIHERTNQDCNNVGDKSLEVVVVRFLNIYIMSRDDLKEEKKI